MSTVLANGTRTSHLPARKRTGRPVVLVLAAAVTLCCLKAEAQNTPSIKLSRNVTVNEVGDGQIKMEMKMPTEIYTKMKMLTPNTAVLLRRLGNGIHWSKLENVTGRFDDNTSSIIIEYKHPGLARAEDDVWEIPCEPDAPMDLVGTFGNTAVFSTAAQTPLGTATAIVRVEIPQAGKELQLRHGPDRVTFRLAPAGTQGSHPSASFEAEAKPQIMTCIAKSYSEQRMTGLWAARSVLKNTGDQTLSNYGVRFRLADYSDWSEWNRVKLVLPGQTVVDPYFPVLNLDKLATLSGARPAKLEIQYEYQQQDGRTVQKTEFRQLQLLSRNQIVYSSMKPEDACGFHDQNNYAPVVLASFVTCDDPLMQQLAGRVCQMGGGLAASANTKDAVKFLFCLYTFMGNNKISYQTPPPVMFGSQRGQHVKYGRDVLNNRAGTCVDLAILYASACQAVGLKPMLILIPGHCFPGVRLPNGEVLAVETTMIGRYEFPKAVEAAMAKLEEYRAKGEIYEIDIMALQNMGVHPFDLPQAELDKNLTFALEVKSREVDPPQPQPQPQPKPEPPQPPKPPVVVSGTLAGVWVSEKVANGLTTRFVLGMGTDGSYAFATVYVTPNGNRRGPEEEGSVRQQGNALTFTPNNGQKANVFVFQVQGEQLDLQVQGSQGCTTFRRVK